MLCHPYDLCVTANKTVKIRVLLKSPQTTRTTILVMEALLTLGTFVKVTPGLGEVTAAVDLGRDRVTVGSLGRPFVVVRMETLVGLEVGVMSGVDASEEALATTRRTG